MAELVHIGGRKETKLSAWQEDLNLATWEVQVFPAPSSTVEYMAGGGARGKAAEANEGGGGRMMTGGDDEGRGPVLEGTVLGTRAEDLPPPLLVRTTVPH